MFLIYFLVTFLILSGIYWYGRIQGWLNCYENSYKEMIDKYEKMIDYYKKDGGFY